jgi:UPF0716 family protein affecting phage T7 exclusion
MATQAADRHLSPLLPAAPSYFVPGWVTKTLVLLVLAPMTWRMINKSRLMW